MNTAHDLVRRAAVLRALAQIKVTISRDGPAAALEVVESYQTLFQTMAPEKPDRPVVSEDIANYWKERALSADRTLAKVMEAIEEVYRS